MNISVVIPNWNGEKYLAECIESLLNQSVKVDIVVVENNSTDNSSNVLDKYPKVTVLKQKLNLGVAGGFTAGFKYCLERGYEYLALFNNDAVADKKWLKYLIDEMDKDTRNGIVTCKFMNFDRKHIDSTGDFMTIYGLPFPRGRNEVDSGQYDYQKEIFAGSGGASLYRAKMLKEIGLFDNDFFAYMEDVDLSFRAQLAGWKVKYQPKALAYHRISATASKVSGFAAYHTAKNFPLLFVKNMPSKLFYKYLPFVIYWYLRMWAGKIIHGGFWPFSKGFFASVFYMPKKIHERRLIQRKRKVSIEYIDGILVHSKAPRPPQIV